MFGLTREKASTVYGAIFDVGSESVGVTILESNHKKQYPTVIFSNRIPLRITKREPTMHEHMRFLREALFSASLIVSRDGTQALTEYNKSARISELLLVVSAPWASTLSRNVHYEGEKDLKISRTLLDDLIASTEVELKKQLGDALADSTLTFTIVERATIDVRVNDYSIQDPVGLYGREISLVQVTGVIPDPLLKTVQEVEEKIFPHTDVKAHTFLLVLYCVLRELYQEEEALTIINVTGECVEIGIVENHTLVESIAIPYGFNALLRLLMSTNDMGGKEAQSELLLFQQKNLAPNREKVISSICDEYCKTLSEKLEEKAKTQRFPGKAFVIAPLSHTPLFVNLLTPLIKKDLHIETEVLTIQPDVLNVMPETKEDISVTITSRFFHKLHGCGELNSK